MMTEFSKKNSHEENIKVSIDKILGSNSILKRTRRTQEDQRKSMFLKVIDDLILLHNRNIELE